MNPSDPKTEEASILKLAAFVIVLALCGAVTAQSGQAPTVTVDPASQITSSNAVVTGTVNPNGLQAGFYVRWGTNTDYPYWSAPGDLPGQDSPVPVTAAMINLSSSTTYHYQLVATNGAGTGYSADLTLTTAEAPPPPPQQPPTVVTGPASAITATQASLSGTVNPNGAIANYIFRWGPTTNYGNSTGYGTPPLAGTLPQAARADLSGLSPGTTYHYQLTATNSAGMSIGGDQTFTTLNAVSIDGHVLAYITNNGTITIVQYTGPGGALAIPGTINGLPVAVIDASAFSGASLTSVSVPENVTTLGYMAFGFTALTNVALPKSLTYIGPQAFYQCQSLPAITIPDNVTNVDAGAFLFCLNLSNLTIGANVRTIGSQAFSSCGSLTRVTIPDNVTNLDDGAGGWGGPEGAFSFCWSLTNVVVGKGLAYLGNGTFTSCANLASVFFQGNAPAFGSSPYPPVATTPFFRDTNTVVCYMPGSTGWDSAYAGQPALLWNPQLLTRDGSFGVRQNRFGFNIGGTPNIPLVVEASSSFAGGTWAPLLYCTLTNGLVYFSDVDWAKQGERFYRIRSP